MPACPTWNAWATPRSAASPSDGRATRPPALPVPCPHLALLRGSLTSLSPTSPAVAGFSLACPCLGGHPAGLAPEGPLWDQGSVIDGAATGHLQDRFLSGSHWFLLEMPGPCPHPPPDTHYWAEAASTVLPTLPEVHHTLEINLSVWAAHGCRCQAPSHCLRTLACCPCLLQGHSQSSAPDTT